MGAQMKERYLKMRQQFRKGIRQKSKKGEFIIKVIKLSAGEKIALKWYV